MIDVIMSMIPNHKLRAIISIGMSTVQRLTGPIIVLNVCVDQTRGNP